MSPTVYYVLHVFSLVVLTGGTFYGFAGAPDSRKKVMIITGIASVIMLVAGFGLQAKLQVGFPGWLIVKLVCWLGLAGLAGIGYRKRSQAGLFMSIIGLIVLVAVIMVYKRPF